MRPSRLGTNRGFGTRMVSPAITIGIGTRLLADHRHLDALFSRLLVDIHGGEWTNCQRTWRRFENDLLDHMAAEEAFILPAFERLDTVETTELREEHATIRKLLADLGVRLELHAVREEHVQELIASLRAHASREDALLYQWAANLSPALQKAVLSRISAHEANCQEEVHGRS